MADRTGLYRRAALRRFRESAASFGPPLPAFRNERRYALTFALAFAGVAVAVLLRPVDVSERVEAPRIPGSERYAIPTDAQVRCASVERVSSGGAALGAGSRVEFVCQELGGQVHLHALPGADEELADSAVLYVKRRRPLLRFLLETRYADQ